jgi:exodeoxyribonuclease V beta subunit
VSPAFAPFAACDVPLTGTSLVEASAGTGKTYAITTLVLRLVLERGLPLEKILVVTFTEAATAELRARVRRRIDEGLAAFDAHLEGRAIADAELRALAQRSADPREGRRRLAAALEGADLAAVFTIHGFCRRVLQDCAFESGVLFDAEILTDARPLRDEVVGDFWARELAELQPVVVGQLLGAGLDLERLRSLADKCARYPDVPILPASTGAAVEPALESFFAAFRAARAAFVAEEVRAALSGAGISKQRYRQDWLRGWLAQVAAYLEREPVHPTTPEVLARFCTAAIAAAVKTGAAPTHPFFPVCDALIAARAACERAAREKVASLCGGLAEFARSELRARKEAAGVLSFDDLLQYLWLALRGRRGTALARAVRKRFPAALIDEFQDTDPIQYEIFARLFGESDAGTAAFFVGDPKQAIYSFRGADVFAYMRAAEATPRDRRFTMGVNWRSDPSLVAAVQHLYARAQRPFLLDAIGVPPVQPRPGARDLFRAPPPWGTAPFEIVFVPRGEGRQIESTWVKSHYPGLVAADIAALLASGATVGDERVAPSHIAVLTRTNQQAFDVQGALRRLSIPSVVLGDESVFESREAEELQRVLETVVNPTDARALRTALATELIGVTAADLVRMETDDREWEAWVHDFRQWNELWSHKGFVQMFRALMVRRGVQERLLSLTDGERRMTNVLHLMELLHTAARTQHLGPTGLLHWFAQAIAHAKSRPEAAQIRLESDEHAVRITTVHRSKGLEYGIVYCPYLWDGMLLHHEDQKVLAFHDPEDDHRLKLEVVLGGKDGSRHWARAEREKLAENLRLLYVALTRARHRCTVFWGAAYEHEKSALCYLLHGAADPEAWIAQADERRKSLDDARMKAEVRALAEASGGAVAVREADLEAPPASSWRPAPAEGAARLAARSATRRVERAWRTASFTQLTASSSAVLAADDPARDEIDETPAGALAPPAADLPLAAFPRGARAGNFFHQVLEEIDFQGEASTHAECVREKLIEHGFAATWQGAVCRALDDVLRAPLAGGASLRDVPVQRRLVELEFCLPVAHQQAGARALVTPVQLAGVFRRHGSAAIPSDYPDSLERLRFLPLHGYLKGFLDLVFAHEGRWYVVDYKTTHLGARGEDYAPSRLSAAMAHGHYFLQYHLYCAALHRWLARRIADYDYERCFGGALYLFVRGMTPARPGQGVFFERPPHARIEALAELLQGGGRAR